MAWMYILRCSDGTYYVGSTTDLEVRLRQHQCGEGANYTRRRLPVEVVFTAEFQRVEDAFRFEKQVQGWSRAKKVALIRGDFDALHDLARAKARGPCIARPGG